MKKILSIIFVVCLLVSTLAACSSSKFVGTWNGTTKDGQSCTLTIKSNGEYVLKVENNVFSEEWNDVDESQILLNNTAFGSVRQIPCTLRNGCLFIDATDKMAWNTATLYKG